jgi:hypothetical protein
VARYLSGHSALHSPPLSRWLAALVQPARGISPGPCLPPVRQQSRARRFLPTSLPPPRRVYTYIPLQPRYSTQLTPTPTSPASRTAPHLFRKLAELKHHSPTDYTTMALSVACAFFFDAEPVGEPSPAALDACALCAKRLGRNSDIFMYRGDTPFCSEDCRYEQMQLDAVHARQAASARSRRPNAAVLAAAENGVKEGVRGELIGCKRQT